MANTITKAELYAELFNQLLDRARKSTLTSLPLFGGIQRYALDWPTHTIRLKEVDVTGLGNTDRNQGYKEGSITAGWGTYQVSYDRNAKLYLDILDNMESTANPSESSGAASFMATVFPKNIVAMISQMAETTAVQWLGLDTFAEAVYSLLSGPYVNEVDAVVYARVAAQVSTLKPAHVVQVNYNPTTDKAVPLFEQALRTISGTVAGVNKNNLILFVSSEMVSGYLQNDVQGAYSLANGTNGINAEGLFYRGIPIVEVPTAKFADQVTLIDLDASSSLDGGFAIPTGSRNLNFILADMTRVRGVNEFRRFKSFDSTLDQDGDRFKALFRTAYDAFVMNKGADGCFVSKRATANT